MFVLNLICFFCARLPLVRASKYTRSSGHATANVLALRIEAEKAYALKESIHFLITASSVIRALEQIVKSDSFRCTRAFRIVRSRECILADMGGVGQGRRSGAARRKEAELIGCTTKSSARDAKSINSNFCALPSGRRERIRCTCA